MENYKFLYGPSIVQLLQAQGLSVREHLMPLLARLAVFASPDDPVLTRLHVVGLVTALEDLSAEADRGEAWCAAVEGMFRNAHTKPAALVVEGDPVQRKFAAKVLERAGMMVNAVDHVDGALLCDTLRYQFILMDYAWPVGRGAELAEEIRAGQGPNINTYILGSSCNHALPQCMAAGMDSFVQKPIDLSTLKMLALRAATGLAVSSVP